jgi:aryl-alcohol dehydrogenase-like predicted oxidoreductase
MNYRSLGKTGLQVSEIGLGTWAFGSPSIYGAVDTAAAERTVRGALDAGVNFFDTAPLYGTKEEDGIAEKVLGRALGAARDRALIATKFGRYHSRVHTNEFFDAANLRWSVEQSLARLCTDRIDVLFFHSPTHPSKINDDIWAEFADLKRTGKVRFIGLSCGFIQDTATMTTNWSAAGRIDVAQIAYSLFYREWEPIIAQLARDGVGIVARESMANGFLAGVFQRDTVFPAGSLNSRYSRDEVAERVDVAERYRRLLVRRDVTHLATAANRWVLDNPGVSLVLSGSKNLAEFLDTARASDCAPYSSAELAEARRLHTKDFGPA